MNTTPFLSSPSPQPARVRSLGRRTAAAAVLVATLGSGLFLAGCGQNFHQDGGAVPAPHASTDGALHATPEGVPNAVPAPADGYAPPRTAGPTQTAAPNLPGGKL